MNFKRDVTKLASSMIAAGCLATAGAAHAVLVDFEDIALGPDTARIDPNYTSHGYLFAPAGDALALLQNGGGCGPACAANGTKTLAAGGVGSGPSTVHPVTMSLGGTTFQLLSFDYAEFVEGGHPANASRIEVIGHVSGGGTISETVLIDGINDGPGGGADFQSVVLGAAWLGSALTSVDFFGFDSADERRGFQLDNLDARTANAPEPGTLALLAMGLLGVGARRRLV